MKSLIILLCLASIAFASLEEDNEKWVNFKSKHGKSYKNVQEEKLRFTIFQENLRKIEEHNEKFKAGKATYTKALNVFADLSKEEFLDKLKHQNAKRAHLKIDSVYNKPEGLQVPDSIDWRDRGAVSGVKDQGDCGSCWSFSVTGVLEGFNYLKTNKMTTYSEQQLIDCSGDYGNYGCDGGDEWTSMEYVQKYGIESEADYPYQGRDRSCRYDANKVVLNINGYVRLESKNEGDLLSAVGTLGPISVAMDASDLDFYESGVYTDNRCRSGIDELNHAVLAVGYGKDQQSGLDYWLVKNSWGGDWGEAGYFKIKRGSNECGIATDSVYPVL